MAAPHRTRRDHARRRHPGSRRRSRGAGALHQGGRGQSAPRPAEARGDRRRAPEGAIRRHSHPGRQEHPAPRVAQSARRGARDRRPRPLLSVPSRVGPGGLQGAVSRRLPEHDDPRRGNSRLGSEALSGRHRGRERLVADIARLTDAVERALAVISNERDVREVEVFAASNRALLARLNYTSHIPCNGVEEPKSVEADGLGVHVAFDGPGGVAVGFGSEPSDLGAEGARRALDKARRAAVRDPEWRSLPRASAEARALADYHDPRLLEISDAELVEAGWTVITGALRTFMASSKLSALVTSEPELSGLGLILGGDVTVLQERVAI